MSTANTIVSVPLICATARVSVAVLGWHDEHDPASDGLSDESLVPRRDDGALTDSRDERLSATPRGVELLAVAPEDALVLHDDGVALLYLGTCPTTTGIVISCLDGLPAGMMISGAFGVIETYGRLSSSVGAGSPLAVSSPEWEPRTSTTKTKVSPAWIGSPGGWSP